MRFKAKLDYGADSINPVMQQQGPEKAVTLTI